MKSEDIKRIKRMRKNGHKYEEIARLLGLTLLQVKSVLDRKEVAIGPDDIVDGERLEERVLRLKSEIRSGLVVVERQREPLYYVALPEDLK